MTPEFIILALLLTGIVYPLADLALRRWWGE